MSLLILIISSIILYFIIGIFVVKYIINPNCVFELDKVTISTIWLFWILALFIGLISSLIEWMSE